MQQFFVILAIALTSYLTGSYAQSNTPSCISCPPADQLGFTLGNSDTTTDPIFCSYPAVAGEDPNDFFCTYNRITGQLVQDNDADLCPASTPSTCGNTRRRRRDALPRSPNAPRVGARSDKSQTMEMRRKLGAAKRGKGVVDY